MKSPKSKNMKEDQYCFPCAVINLPEKYGKARGSGKGGRYVRSRQQYRDFLTMPLTEKIVVKPL